MKGVFSIKLLINKIRWYLKRNSYPILFRGSAEELRDQLLKRKWYEHTWYILDNTKSDREKVAEFGRLCNRMANKLLDQGKVRDSKKIHTIKNLVYETYNG